jgi:hypothetical protein
MENTANICTDTNAKMNDITIQSENAPISKLDSTVISNEIKQTMEPNEIKQTMEPNETNQTMEPDEIKQTMEPNETNPDDKSTSNVANTRESELIINHINHIKLVNTGMFNFIAGQLNIISAEQKYITAELKSIQHDRTLQLLICFIIGILLSIIVTNFGLKSGSDFACERIVYSLFK